MNPKAPAPLRIVVGEPDTTFIDSLTLFDARPLFYEAPTASKRFNTRALHAMSAHPQQSAFLGLVEALILCERCVVDEFTLLASEASKDVLSKFPDICATAYIAERDRARIYHSLLTSTQDDAARSLLESERDLVSTHYYRHGTALPGATSRPSTFAEEYYDPSDRFKHRAIATGVYEPLNALRAQFYLHVAEIYAVPYLPHPRRERLLSSVLKRRTHPGLAAARYITDAVSASLDDIRSRIVGTAQATAPPLAATVLRRAGLPRHVPDVIREIRDSKRARRFRAWCGEFRQALSEDSPDPSKAQRMWKLVQEVTEKWKGDLDEEVRYRTRSIKIGLGPTGAKADADMGIIRDRIVRISGRYRPLLFLNDILRVKQ